MSAKRSQCAGFRAPSPGRFRTPVLPSAERKRVLADAGRGEILIEELFDLVMRRHFVALAAFLVKAHHQRLPPG